MTYNIYEYTPSLRAAFVFAVAFSLTAIALIFTSIRDWTWHFTPIILRLILESSKFCQFGTRRWYDQVEIAGYIAWGISLGYTSYCSNTLCSGCPSFDSSFDLYAFRSSHCRLRWRVVVPHSIILDDKKKFVTGDFLCFIVQCVDVGITSSTSHSSLGKTIILIGLALQLTFSGFSKSRGRFYMSEWTSGRRCRWRSPINARNI